MNKQIKIVLMAFIGVLLPCLSFAYPDFYYYNNFLVGQSPYRIFTDDFSAHTETELWEEYLPSISNDSSTTLRSGIVTSFDTRLMSGTTIPSAAPLIDMDLVLGNYFELPAGHCVAVWSGSGQGFHLEVDSQIVGFYIGSSRPAVVRDGEFFDRRTTFIYDSSSTEPLDFHMSWRPNYGYNSGGLWGKEWQLRIIYSNVFGLSHDRDNQPIEVSPYSPSSVYLLYNNTTSSVRVRNRSNVVWGSKLDKETIPFTDLRWILSSSRTVDGTFDGEANPGESVSRENRILCLPHIKGDIDLYSNVWETIGDLTYVYQCYYTVSLNFSNFDVDNLRANFSLLYNPNLLNQRFQFSVSEFGAFPTSVPLFLHPYNVVINFNTSGVYVNGGWLEISNFDELVALLKEQGVGDSDLTRVLELLEDINTGGNTGQNVKELVGILEGYHNQLIQNGDFGSVTNIFDTYKNLLDFSSDMHWLITANNALFGYFAGFIMLCAMFLILNRIMR